MIINVYNIGTVVDVTERIEAINVKDWRYYRREDNVVSCQVLHIHGENAKVKWLNLNGMTEAECSFDSRIELARISDESKMTVASNCRINDVSVNDRATLVVKKDGFVDIVFVDKNAQLIVEAGAQMPYRILGTGKIINYNKEAQNA